MAFAIHKQGAIVYDSWKWIFGRQWQLVPPLLTNTWQKNTSRCFCVRISMERLPDFLFICCFLLCARRESIASDDAGAARFLGWSTRQWSSSRSRRVGWSQSQDPQMAPGGGREVRTGRRIARRARPRQKPAGQTQAGKYGSGSSNAPLSSHALPPSLFWRFIIHSPFLSYIFQVGSLAIVNSFVYSVMCSKDANRVWVMARLHRILQLPITSSISSNLWLICRACCFYWGSHVYM